MKYNELIAFPLDEAMAMLERLGWECSEVVTTRSIRGSEALDAGGHELLVVRQQATAPCSVRLTVARHPGHPEAE